MTSYPQIDYTSRDFVSLVQDMTALIPQRVPEWTDRSTNDFGTVLVELFAYMGDILSYYGDRIANEAFLPTATQRESVLAIAKMLDYYPSGPIAASVGLKFTNTSGNFIWVLKGTQVATKAQSTPAPDPSKPFQTYQLPSHAPVFFETVADVLVPPNGSATVTAIEGVTYNELTGTSTGGGDQDFPLFRSPVINHSVSVSVGTTNWKLYERLIDAYATTRAYALETDGDGATHVVFGDNSSGAIPPVGAAINVTYRVGGGRRGNVVAGAVTRIISTVPAGIKVTNPAAAVGGGDAETIDQIKDNAPRSLFALERALTIADFIHLALRVGGVAKASVPPPAAYSSVTMYIAPTGGEDATTDTSGNVLTSFKELQQRVLNYLTDKVPIGTTVTMGTPTYVPVSVGLSVVVKPKYKQLEVRSAVIKAVLALFAFDNVVFGDSITLKDMHTALATVPGLQSVSVTQMARDVPNGVTVDGLDNPLTGTGWSVNTTYKVEGVGSNQHVGTGFGSRTFSAIDLSPFSQLQIRGSYTGPANAYLVTTMTLTDVNGSVWALGTQVHGAQGLAAGTFNAARWNLNWPSDPDVFDATQVAGYSLTTVPKNIPGGTFYLDQLTAYVGTTTDINFAPNELPASMVLGQPGKSSLIVTLSGGL